MSDPTYAPPPSDRSVKVPHLVFGLLFLGVAGIWALGASDAISGQHLAVLGPAVLILAGVVGLAASLANGRNRRRRSARAARTPEGHKVREVRHDPFHDEHTYEADPQAELRTDTHTDAHTEPVADDGSDPTEEIR